MIDDIPLAVARFVETLGGLSLLGAVSFQLLTGHPPSRPLRAGSFLLVLVGAVAWLWLASTSYGASPWLVLTRTQFGPMLLVRVVAFGVAARFAKPAIFSAFMAALGLASLAFISHAAASGDAWGDNWLWLHLLGAGIWLGGLVPLWQAGTGPARRFGNLAAAAVLVIVTSGVAQGLTLIGDWPGLFGTVYGQAALVKFLLLLVMLVVALFNRYGTAGRLGWLRLGIAVEIGLGLVIVGAATIMASSPPAAHSVPVWPFPWALSFEVLGEPELHDEIFAALQALLGAFALLLLAVLARRVRWFAVAAAAGIVFYAVPHFDLLLVPAVPTSFQRSPTLFAATGIAAASTLYPTHCASCHGVRGQGDGPEAAKQTIPPADLTAAHLWDHPDGALFWMIQAGSRTAVGSVGMKGLGDRLDRDQIWALIDYIRARNAALAADDKGNFDQPVAAPALSLTCAEPGISDLAGFVAARGALVIARAAPAASAIPTIYLSAAPPVPGSCVASDKAAWVGYAILADRDALPDGAWFTVDANGWLRQRGNGTADDAWRKIRTDPLSPIDHPHIH